MSKKVLRGIYMKGKILSLYIQFLQKKNEIGRVKGCVIKMKLKWLRIMFDSEKECM